MQETARLRPARRAALDNTDLGLRAFFVQVFNVMGVGMTLTALTSFFVMSTPAVLALLITTSEAGTKSLGILWWVAVAIEFGLVWRISSPAKMTEVNLFPSLSLFLIYAFLTGVTLAPALSLYTTTSMAKVFFITAGMFGGAALWGHTTKYDIIGWGGFLMMGLIGLIIAMLVNMFLASPAIDFVVSVIGVMIFTGLTAWDMQVFRQLYSELGHSGGLVVRAALALYLDFLNLFLYLLRFFGVKKD